MGTVINVNFEYYKIFDYVAKHQNFTKAAHGLNNSQKLRLHELKQYPMICLGEDTTTYHFYSGLFHRYGSEQDTYFR